MNIVRLKKHGKQREGTKMPSTYQVFSSAIAYMFHLYASVKTCLIELDYLIPCFIYM